MAAALRDSTQRLASGIRQCSRFFASVTTPFHCRVRKLLIIERQLHALEVIRSGRQGLLDPAAILSGWDLHCHLIATI